MLCIPGMPFPTLSALKSRSPESPSARLLRPDLVERARIFRHSAAQRHPSSSGRVTGATVSPSVTRAMRSSERRERRSVVTSPVVSSSVGPWWPARFVTVELVVPTQPRGAEERSATRKPPVAFTSFRVITAVAQSCVVPRAARSPTGRAPGRAGPTRRSSTSRSGNIALAYHCRLTRFLIRQRLKDRRRSAPRARSNGSPSSMTLNPWREGAAATPPSVVAD
jgi:hypothetical protein